MARNANSVRSESSVQDTFTQPRLAHIVTLRDTSSSSTPTPLTTTIANMATSQERISVHSLADLKNTSDDAIPAYLNSLSFVQSHTLTDTRLILGYSAFIICAATFYWDYTFGFDSTKHYTAVAVLIYTLLNGALTFWIWGVEKGTVYIGTNKAGEKIQVASKTEKHVPIYQLTVTVWAKGEKGVGKVVSIRKPFTQWFDKKGFFVVLPFQQMIASAVDAVGKLDPGKVVKKEKKVVSVEEGEEDKSMDDKWASLLAESSGVSVAGGEETSTPKGSKKRSKKTT
ncbi:related to signal peptidase 18 KD subunit [Rhynchosporium secalis]|uniref:Signal peptidase complex subunit 2 n=1 Tax=Rhynchosporium secalis TaxID=38038 RepID=A0A1E1MAB3_RHYSE|nr:related to signal peptidase 18 KD subunit [Rhynchosporium secalis]